MVDKTFALDIAAVIIKVSDDSDLLITPISEILTTARRFYIDPSSGAQALILQLSD